MTPRAPMLRTAAALLLVFGLPLRATPVVPERVPGEVRAVRDVRVPAEVSGRVIRRLENESARVNAGDVVVSLDAVFMRAAARAAAAAVRRAEARREWSELEAERVRGLFEKGSVGASDRDRADLALREAEASLESAQATAEEAEARLARAEIRAPFDGELVRVYPQTGEYLRVGETAFRIIDDSSVKIVAYVPAPWVPGLRPGDRIPVESDGAETDRSVLEATIFSVAAAAEGRARTFRMEARAAAPGASAKGLWRPGMTVSIRRPAPSAERPAGTDDGGD